MLSIYAAAVAVCLLSAIIGQAVCVVSGERAWWGLAPPIGFAVILLLARATIMLPGAGTTAFVVLLAAGVLSLAVTGGRPFPRQAVRDALPVAAIALTAASLPFAANGRFGPLGVSFENDFAFHTAWAQVLHTGSSPFDLIYPGYPVGPHSLVAALATGTGGVEGTFVGLLLAVPVLTAVTAWAALGALAPGWRLIAAGLVGLPYLGAAYLAQGAFKEPMLALLFLGFVLTLRRLSETDDWHLRQTLPLPLFVAASVTTFSQPAFAWPVALLVGWLVAEIATGRRVRLARSRRDWLGLLVAGAVLSFVAVHEAPGAWRFVTDVLPGVHRQSGAVGNFLGAISPLEGVGVWFSSDFRLPASETFAETALTIGALLAISLGVVWSLRRRDLVVPGALILSAAIYAVARVYTRPYISTKALVVLAPLAILVAAAPLAGLPGPSRIRRAMTGGWGQRVKFVLAVTLMGAAAWCSGLALRGAWVGPDDHYDALAALRSKVKQSPTLFLGHDDYLISALWGASLSTPDAYGLTRPVATLWRHGKPQLGEVPFDFDTADSSGLDVFRFVITTRTPYASAPPTNWHRAVRTRYYDLWERDGPTRDHEILRELGAPGELLSCSDPADRRLSRRPGRAAVRPNPILGGRSEWRLPSGGPLGFNGTGAALAQPGRTIAQTLQLKPGRWDLSIQYFAAQPLTIRVRGLKWRLPANLEQMGPYWSAGTVTSPGKPITVSVTVGEDPLLAIRRPAAVGELAATRHDAKERFVPLRRACGQYVDWFVLTGDARPAPRSVTQPTS